MSSTSADAAPTRRGFQPSSRRRNRIAAGIALAAVAIGGNVLLYSSLDDSEAVVQVVRDVPAGEQITLDALRTVDADVDATVNVIPGTQLDSLVGSYAKVRLVAGSLVTSGSLQASPLIADGNSVLAIQVAEGTLPIGLRERVPVLLVIPARQVGTATAEGAEVVSITGRVVGLPTETTSALGVQSLSVEVAARDAATLASADDVRVVLTEPSEDPAAVADPGDADQRDSAERPDGFDESDGVDEGGP